MHRVADQLVRDLEQGDQALWEELVATITLEQASTLAEAMPLAIARTPESPGAKFVGRALRLPPDADHD